jgi:hypothetical protein
VLARPVPDIGPMLSISVPVQQSLLTLDVTMHDLQCWLCNVRASALSCCWKNEPLLAVGGDRVAFFINVNCSLGGLNAPSKLYFTGKGHLGCNSHGSILGESNSNVSSDRPQSFALQSERVCSEEGERASDGSCPS